MPRQVRSPYDENKDWLDDSRQQAASGGSGILHQATVTLDNDQIIALPTTAVEIVSALGEGKAIFPVLVQLRCAAVVDYSAIDAGAVIAINNGGNVGILSEGVNSSVTGLLVPGDPVDAANAFISLLQRDGDTTFVTGISGYYDSDIGNKPLKIQTMNGGHNFGGGDSANTLVVSVAYMIFNTVTGEFE